jgi:hypothetical protein
MGRRADICPGACNRRYAQAWDTFETAYERWEDEMQARADNPSQDDSEPPEPPAEPALAPVLGDPTWDSRCASRIRHALVDIGDLAALLESWADGHRGAASGETIPTRRATAPSPSPITDTLDELYGRLAEVEADWREFAGHPPRPNRARTGDARQRTLAYLHEQLDRILLHPGSVAFGQAALSWQARLQKLTKTDPVVRSRPGRCPRCSYVNTLKTRDDGYTECGNCGRLLNEGEYERDVLGSADGAVVADSQAERQAS